MLIARDNPTTLDLLGRNEALASLELAVRQVQTPACVALYGSWGMGKSSLLRTLEALLSEQGIAPAADLPAQAAHGPSLPTLWFDPWEYEARADDVVLGLVVRLVRELRRVHGAPLSDDLMSAAKAFFMSFLKSGVQLALETGGTYAGIGPWSKVGADAGAALLDQVLRDDDAEHDPAQATAKRFRRVVESMVKAHQRRTPGADRFVVLLDDLDRCTPDAVVQLLDAIKLIMCGDSEAPVVFVFALDRHIVSEAIRKKYSGSSQYSGENYLEKIFDLSLEVPRIAHEGPDAELLRNVLGTWLAQTKVSDASSAWLQARANVLVKVLRQPCFANPRVIRRTVNRLALFLGAVELQARSLDATLESVEAFERFVAWIAGCERYRTFRDLYFTLSDAEFGALHEAAVGARPEPAQGAVADLLRNPGFRLYYAEALGHGLFDAALAIQSRRRDHIGFTNTGTQIFTPRWSDALLRRYGL